MAHDNHSHPHAHAPAGADPHIAMQKQALQQQGIEIDLALKELATAPRAYKFIGGLLVETDVAKTREELTRKRESIAARLDSLSQKTRG